MHIKRYLKTNFHIFITVIGLLTFLPEFPPPSLFWSILLEQLFSARWSCTLHLFWHVCIETTNIQWQTHIKNTSRPISYFYCWNRSITFPARHCIGAFCMSRCLPPHGAVPCTIYGVKLTNFYKRRCKIWASYCDHCVDKMSIPKTNKSMMMIFLTIYI